MARIAPPPTGKREQNKAQNRKEILDAARTVFGEIGFEAATVRDIIRGTSLSVGAFYNYFRTKEEVFAELANDGARRFAPTLSGLRETSPDLETFVRRALSAYFEFLADEYKVRMARAPAGHGRRPHIIGQTPEMAAVFNEVKSALGRELLARHGPSIDADFAAAACISIAREVGDQMIARRPVDIEAAVNFAAAMILGGLGGLSAQS